MPPSPDPAGVDLGTTGGEWLFKQGDMLLGPVGAKVLVDKLYRGEIDAQTQVSPAGEERFIPIEQVAFFQIHAKKAQVKVKLDRASEAKSVAEGRKRTTRVASFGAVGIVVVGLGIWGATYLAIHKPWRSGSDAELELSINVEAPTIAIASTGDDDVAFPSPGSPSHPGAPGAPGPHHPNKHPHAPGAPGAPGAPVPSAADPDGLATAEFDQSAIQSVVNNQTKTLYPCIKAEAVRVPGKGGRIPMEFTVGNDGRVNKLWIDNPDYRSGPLYDCMLKTLKGWPFKAYQGEAANVSLNFSFGPKS